MSFIGYKLIQVNDFEFYKSCNIFICSKWHNLSFRSKRNVLHSNKTENEEKQKQPFLLSPFNIFRVCFCWLPLYVCVCVVSVCDVCVWGCICVCALLMVVVLILAFHFLLHRFLRQKITFRPKKTFGRVNVLTVQTRYLSFCIYLLIRFWNDWIATRFAFGFPNFCFKL